ncbi:MAG: glycosyltransferase family 4 protein, partial [Clostridium sp.]|uniref:glycosyltransferase family 4 protein n=1 Tax=Clostridium sp. TaxID=1506 RepID=UPI0025C369F6
MNVLFINHDDSLGGASRSLLGIIDELKTRDVNFTVVIPKNQRGGLREELRRKGINFVLLDFSWWMRYKDELEGKPRRMLLKLKTASKNLIASLKLIRICRRLKIDVIHTNSSVVNIGGIVHSLTGIKHVWHIREFGLEDHGICFIDGFESATKFLNNNSDKVVAVSKSIYDKYKDAINEEKLIVVHNGVKSRNFNKDYSNDNLQFNLLIAGAIKKSKGQKQAILAVNKLIKDGYDNVFLYIAGKDEAGCEGELKALVKELKIEKHIKFLGFINDLDTVRANIDVELVCSKKEGFGRVTVEAMMAGNPIIGTNTGATTELIKSNYNGLLYNDGDFEELARCIK